jgi:hypothetical protein
LGGAAVVAAYLVGPDAVWPVAVASTGTLIALGITQGLEARLAR